MLLIPSLLSDVYNKLRDYQRSNNQSKMPGLLAEFIDKLIHFAVRDKKVSGEKLGQALGSRFFASSILQPALPIHDVIQVQGPWGFKPEFLNRYGKLTSTKPLISLINFINDKFHPWGHVALGERNENYPLFKRLGKGDVSKGRRFVLVSKAINNFLNFESPNHGGELLEENIKVGLAKKLISHRGLGKIKAVTPAELEIFANSAPDDFIHWVLSVTLDALDGDMSKANEIALSDYDDLLRLLNNLKSLLKN